MKKVKELNHQRCWCLVGNMYCYNYVLTLGISFLMSYDDRFERSNEVVPSAGSVVVLTTLSSCSRLNSTLSSTATAGGGVLVSAPSAPPPTMPVFPLRPSAPATQYSPYSPSRFHIDKRCRHRCSWKCCSIALILLSVALTAMLAYFGGQFFLFSLILLFWYLCVYYKRHSIKYLIA